MSICSQKSRTTLLEAGLEFGSNEVLIIPPVNENYAPDYVRLRLASAVARTTPLVESYSGHTAVSTEGFDPHWR